MVVVHKIWLAEVNSLPTTALEEILTTIFPGTCLGLFIKHCVKSVRIRSYSGPYFSAFGLNTESYAVKLLGTISLKCPFF